MPQVIEAQSDCAQALRASAGKYLTFRLGDEVYGLEILKVQEIIGMMNVTKVPKTPVYVRGVINLRGKVIPVVDLRLKFGLDSRKDTERTCIIVVQIKGEKKVLTIGVLVDEVSEVLDITDEQIEEPPSFGTQIDLEFIMGIGKIGEKVIMILDVDKVITAKEISDL